MKYKYTVCISPESHFEKFDYFEVEGIEFINPVHKDDQIVIDDCELEIRRVLHEKSCSRLYVECDEEAAIGIKQLKEQP